MIDYKHHHWEISSRHKLFDLKLKDTWEYRDLIWLMVRRDFVSMYKQTILGPLWYIIQPVFTTIIYSVVFGGIAGISTEGLPKPVFYMAGITMWGFFADCLLKTSGVFRENAGVFGKVYFPRLVVPIGNLFGSIIRLGMQVLLFGVFLFYYASDGAAIHPNIYILLFPGLILLVALMALGVGMVISALTTKYRDLSFLVGFGMQLLMYATTVIYPLSAAPSKYKTLIELNPMTSVIEAFRYGALGTGSFQPALLLYAVIFTFVLLIIGLAVFTRVERNFIDTV